MWPINKMIASGKVITLSQAMTTNKAVLVANNGRSRLIRSLSITMRRPMIAETPITRSMLAILEPIALATGISTTPSAIANNEEISSGSDVPAAIIVTPIINGESPIARPMRSELLRKKSAPLSITSSDTRNIPIHINIIGKVYQVN